MPVPSLLRLSACPHPRGHSLVLPLTTSTGFDIGDGGIGVNHYPQKAETKVTSSWSCFSSGPPGTALGLSSLSTPTKQEGLVLLLSQSSTWDLRLTWYKDSAQCQPRCPSRCRDTRAGAEPRGCENRGCDRHQGVCLPVLYLCCQTMPLPHTAD